MIHLLIRSLAALRKALMILSAIYSVPLDGRTKMIISAHAINGICTVELKLDGRYAVVCGESKGFPAKLIMKCIYKLILNKSEQA